jgi:DNA-binding MarR family transcriptional regulator
MTAPRSRINRSPIHLLHRASQAVDTLFDTVMMSVLTPRQLAVLVSVAARPGLNQAQLVQLTGVARSTLSVVVNRLQRKGLLQRTHAKKDARAYTVNLTDGGRVTLRAAVPAWERIEKRVLDTLPPDHREQFIDGLQTIIRALEHVAPSPLPLAGSRKASPTRR